MKTKDKADFSQELPVIAADRYTRIVDIPSAKISLDKPTMIVGISDSGMVGSICINHIIGQLKMHQIASIESQHLVPAAIFVNRKFRHPFRIYADAGGKICAIICELPILLQGVLSIANLMADWAVNRRVDNIIIVGSILPGDFNPSSLQRKAILLQNISEGTNSSFSDRPVVEDENPSTAQGAVLTPESAFIPGLAGSLLSACALRGISCTAILAPSFNSPDPEGAAIVLEALPTIAPEVVIDTSELRGEAEAIKKRLEEYMKMHLQHAENYEKAMGRRDAEGIYK